MTAFVDNAAVPHRGKARFHLGADSIEELHQFAKDAGIASCWFHKGAKHLHYDITEEEREVALERGARPVTSREFVRLAPKAPKKHKTTQKLQTPP